MKMLNVSSLPCNEDVPFSSAIDGINGNAERRVHLEFVIFIKLKAYVNFLKLVISL